MATVKDRRLFGKMAIGYTNNPKIYVLSDAAFRCWHEALDHCRDQQTDGLLARRYALARWSPEVLAELCENDPEKPSLIECPEGWRVHDYADHNDTKAEIEERSERNRQAGKQGGLAKSYRSAKRTASEPLSESVADKDKAEDEAKLFLVDLGEGVTSGNASATRPLCSKHPNGNDSGTPCRGCQRVREWDEREAVNATAEADRAKSVRRAAIDSCALCDDNGMTETAHGLIRCDHSAVAHA